MNSMTGNVDDEPYTPAGFANFDEEKNKSECIAHSAISEFYTETKWDIPDNVCRNKGNTEFLELGPSNTLNSLESQELQKSFPNHGNLNQMCSNPTIYNQQDLMRAAPLPLMVPRPSQLQISSQNSLMRMIPPNVDPNLLPAFLKPQQMTLPVPMLPSAMPHTVPHIMPGVVMLSHGMLPPVSVPNVPVMQTAQKGMSKNRKEKILSERSRRKMEAMARVRAEKEARRLQKAQEKRNIADEKKKKEEELLQFEDEPSKKFMILTKDTFVIRLRDVDSFSRNNEIWRIDNHVLIQKFTGVPSLRAPARQFQSTNRMAGYDMRATWRFYIIDSEKVEYDRYSAEITIHDFPSITELREAKKNAELRDEEFRDVETDEYREKLMQMEEKTEERKKAKLRKRLERAQKRQTRINENWKKNTTKDQYKIPKKINWFPKKISDSSATAGTSVGKEDKETSDKISSVIRELLQTIIDKVAHSEDAYENEDQIEEDYEEMDQEVESDGSDETLSESEGSGSEESRMSNVNLEEKKIKDLNRNNIVNMKYEVCESGDVPDVAYEMTI